MNPVHAPKCDPRPDAAAPVECVQADAPARAPLPGPGSWIRRALEGTDPADGLTDGQRWPRARMHLEVRSWWLHGLLLRYFGTGFDYRRAESLREELERLSGLEVKAARLRVCLGELYQAGLVGHLRVGTRTLRWRWIVGRDGRRQLSDRLAAKLAEQAGHLEIDGRWYSVADAIRTGARSAGHAVAARTLLKAKRNHASAVAAGLAERVPVVALEVEPDWIQAEPIPGPGFDPLVEGIRDALALEQDPAEPEPEPSAVGMCCRDVPSGLAPASTTTLTRENQSSTRTAEPEVVEQPPEEPERPRSAAGVSSTGGADPTGLLAEAEELRAERNRRELEAAELLRLLKASKLLQGVNARRRVVERIASWCSERGRSAEQLAQVLESLERHATGWKSPKAAVVTLTKTSEDLDALWSEIEQGTLQAEHQRQAERLEVERQTELLRRSMLEAVLHPLGLEGWRGQGSNPVRWRDWPEECRDTCEQAAARLKAEPEYRAELEERLRATEERLRALDAKRAPELVGGAA